MLAISEGEALVFRKGDATIYVYNLLLRCDYDLDRERRDHGMEKELHESRL